MNTRITFEGTPNSPVLVFSNSLGTDLRMWDAVVPYLLPYFRILRYDTRGHGQAEVSPGPYTVAQLGQDVIDILDAYQLDQVYFCGLSMGGQIGQWLGIHHGHRFKKLVLSNTAAQIGTSEAWNDRIELVRKEGLQAIWAGTQRVWFGDRFLQTEPPTIKALEGMFFQHHREGYASCCAAVRDADFREALHKIQTPTLVIAGEQDPATTVSEAEYLGQHIADSQLLVLPGRHIPAIEHAETYAQALVAFFVGKSTLEKGMHVRRTVLGDAHVDRAGQKINDFNRDFQSFISHYAWGEIWTRPGLSKHNRSLITLSMMIALNRKAEFKMHVRAALHNGVSISEIKELILQSGIYCGLPAANEAFHSAQEVFDEEQLDD